MSLEKSMSQIKIIWMKDCRKYRPHKQQLRGNIACWTNRDSGPRGQTGQSRRPVCEHTGKELAHALSPAYK